MSFLRTPWYIAFVALADCVNRRQQQMSMSIRWTIMSIVVIVLFGCGGEPRAPVDDPRAYAIESLQTMDLNTWWQEYRNPDPALLGQIVDEVAADQPDGLPADAGRLDTFIRNPPRTQPSSNFYARARMSEVDI